MAQEVIDTGTLPNDGKGDTLRVAGQKINNNFTQLFNYQVIQILSYDSWNTII